MGNLDEEIDIIIDLQERGYDHDFVLANEHIRCLQYDELIAPDDFDVLEIHQCKGKFKLKNSCIIYGIKLCSYEIKGILMSNYQSYSCGLSIHLWKKLYSTIKPALV